MSHAACIRWTALTAGACLCELFRLFCNNSLIDQMKRARGRRRTQGVQSLATSAPHAKICTARAVRRCVRGFSTAPRALGVVREP